MEMLLEAPFCAAAEWEVPVVTAWGCSCKGVRGGWLNGTGGFLLSGFSGKGREQQNCRQELGVGREGVLGDSHLSKGAGAGQAQGQVCGTGLLHQCPVPTPPSPTLRAVVAEGETPREQPGAVKPGIDTKGKK